MCIGCILCCIVEHIVYRIIVVLCIVLSITIFYRFALRCLLEQCTRLSEDREGAVNKISFDGVRKWPACSHRWRFVFFQAFPQAEIWGMDKTVLKG